jgi:hypothetical protein
LKKELGLTHSKVERLFNRKKKIGSYGCVHKTVTQNEHCRGGLAKKKKPERNIPSRLLFLLNKFKKVLYISFRAYDNVIIGTPITNK